MPGPAYQAHGWSIYLYPPFAARFRALIAEVQGLERANPEGFKRHASTKLLGALTGIIRDLVPRNPDAPEFRLGATLGPYTQWRRVKGHGLPVRYRLFYRFMSKAKVLVFAWLNDDDTLRKADAKTDVYAVFQKMLARGEVPDDFEALLTQAQESAAP